MWINSILNYRHLFFKRVGKGTDLTLYSIIKWFIIITRKISMFMYLLTFSLFMYLYNVSSHSNV